MNKRIKLLAEQAGFQSSDVFGVMANSKPIQENIEKFAELIIRECTEIVADAVDHREPASTYVSKIKQHFGVEL